MMSTMAKMLTADSDLIKVINFVKPNLILWDSRVEDYKLSERKPPLWKVFADKVDSDVCEHIFFITLTFSSLL